nr:hypothetical protein [Tanacetum cinerariifolium]
MIRAQVGNLSSHTTKYSSPALTQKEADDVANEGAAGVDVDVVSATAEPSIHHLHLLINHKNYLPPHKVKKLERKNKLKVYGLRRLRKVGTAQRVESSTDTVMDDQEDASKQVEIIANIDANEDITLKDVAVVEKTAEIEKNEDVLIMKDDELEPTKLKEVVEVVTTAKLMTEVVTVASATITAATTPITVATINTAPSVARRRKGVVIRDPKETATIYHHTF